MENTEENSEKIWKIWKKGKLNSEMIWKISKISMLVIITPKETSSPSSAHSHSPPTCRKSH
jgi:predicted nucleic acid-binding protein